MMLALVEYSKELKTLFCQGYVLTGNGLQFKPIECKTQAVILTASVLSERELESCELCELIKATGKMRNRSHGITATQMCICTGEKHT